MNKKNLKPIFLIISTPPIFIFFLLFGFISFIVETPYDELSDLSLKEKNELLKIKSSYYLSFFSSDLAPPCDMEYFTKDVPPDARFGIRIHPVTKLRGSMHTGHDFPTPLNSNIYAISDGLVTYSKNAGAYGNLIILSHAKFKNKNFESRYAHLSKILVKKGDTVKKGDIIGLAGSTGRSTGSHLHFEIRLDNEAFDPLSFYPKLE